MELNPYTVDLVSKRFGAFSGDVYHRPGVRAVVGEGRNFLNTTRDTYDMIQISLADSWAATTAGGFYALPTNIGSYEQDKFSALTEVGLKLSCDIDCHWRASIGYSFLYWRYAARAGDQIDTTLSAGEFPPGQGSASLHPQFPFNTSAFWAQGLNFGVECRF